MHPAHPAAAARIPAFTGSALAWLLPLAPLAVMAWPLYARVPGLQAGAGDVLGLGAVLALLACLAVSPVAAATGMRNAARWRRHFGLCVFALGAAGLIIAVTGGPSSSALAWRAAGDSRSLTGTLIVALLVPLTLTSSRLAQKVMGGHWKAWQRRLTWTAWAAVTLHLLVLGSRDVTAAWLLASGPLLVTRIPAVRADITRWRRSRWADVHLWILTGMAVTAFAAGSGVLIWMEAAAIAGLYRYA
jgi:DMSO/TMAO reductase YedYZ heme-binding membrane subunit